MLSLLDNAFTNLLSNSINPHYLQTAGFKTYKYMEDNIKTVIDVTDNDRPIKVATINDINVWLVGHYDYTKLKGKYDSVFMGKSIAIVKNSENTGIFEELNLIFDTGYISNFNFEEPDNLDNFKLIREYWEDIFEGYIVESGLFKHHATMRYSGNSIYGFYIKDFIDFRSFVVDYHMLMNLHKPRKGTLFEPIPDSSKFKLDLKYRSYINGDIEKFMDTIAIINEYKSS